MKRIYLFIAFGLLLVTGCAKDPAQEYKLSAEQLAWQPYKAGQTLRFGHDKDNKVRTYLVLEVQDRLETQYRSASWLPFPQKEPPLYQHITVRVQRSDSISRPWSVLDTYLHDESYGRIELRAEVEWETLYGNSLPLDSVNSGAAIDSLYYPGVEFLPSVTLGPTSYSQVLSVRNQYPNSTPAGSKPTRRLYYAKGKGVVAFIEDGTGLWYQL